MPLYEYQCEACGEELELLVRPGEEPACTACGSPKLVKQFSVPAAHVTGHGGLPIHEGQPFGGCGKPGCGPGGCGMGMG